MRQRRFRSTRRQIFLPLSRARGVALAGKSRGSGLSGNRGQVPQFGTGFLVDAGTDLACSRFSLQVAPVRNRRNDQGRPRGAPSPRRLGLSVFMPKEDGRLMKIAFRPGGSRSGAADDCPTCYSGQGRYPQSTPVTQNHKAIEQPERASPIWRACTLSQKVARRSTETGS